MNHYGLDIFALNLYFFSLLASVIIKTNNLNIHMLTFCSKAILSENAIFSFSIF